ncbi:MULTISPECIES: Uma2 family endonuclease [Actinoalloteichus]|uniref:Putative restriction endonuclease domain-containing protein n=1 Tax=Actinoalloteichus fjordicus TaxID=1612552 RepID=A0AAC9LA33_9PSEU|nr:MULTISPECIES: Uma2 family endonuclease [Actinoalloteichus]APU12812.1 hypothetical protein UA74_03660 [Actinoalloteichus fjordicus]APU18784.1 hypothetical protein UA75_03760 [Actinoalloteichus sp. GBA129-24]
MSSALSHHDDPYSLGDWEGLEHDPEGPRIELIGGRLHVTPAPALSHQAFSDEIRRLVDDALWEHDRPDLMVISAIGVRLAPGMGFIPDLAVIRAPQDGATKVVASDVSLVVEIVSPRTRRQDRMSKPAAYAEAGVPYYWRVEPTVGEPPTVVCGELVDGGYVTRVIIDADNPAIVTSAPVPVPVDVDRLYSRVFRRSSGV